MRIARAHSCSALTWPVAPKTSVSSSIRSDKRRGHAPVPVCIRGDTETNSHALEETSRTPLIQRHAARYASGFFLRRSVAQLRKRVSQPVDLIDQVKDHVDSLLVHPECALEV